MTKRRLLFTNFDQVLAEVDALEARGYSRSGQWNLPQICQHLRLFIRCSMHGFDWPPIPWPRRILGKCALYTMLATHWMPSGFAAPERFQPHTLPDASPETLEAFRKTIGEFENHSGPFHPSPLLGVLTLDQWRRIHLLHAAHHLSFLLPIPSCPS